MPPNVPENGKLKKVNHITTLTKSNRSGNLEARGLICQCWSIFIKILQWKTSKDNCKCMKQATWSLPNIFQEIVAKLTGIHFFICHCLDSPCTIILSDFILFMLYSVLMYSSLINIHNEPPSLLGQIFLLLRLNLKDPLLSQLYLERLVKIEIIFK